MNRTVWHHKEVFQSPPRGVFRSRFLWDSLVVFTLRCSLTILQPMSIHCCYNCSNYCRIIHYNGRHLYKAPFSTRLRSKQTRCFSALPCFARALLADRTRCCLMLALARWCLAKFKWNFFTTRCLQTTHRYHNAGDTPSIALKLFGSKIYTKYKT